MLIRLIACLFLALAVPSTLPAHTGCWDPPEFEAYKAEFIRVHRESGTMPAQPVPLNAYMEGLGVDRDYSSAWLHRIRTDQNQGGYMAWGFSYFVMSMNDMFRATGDTAYLETNLRLLRATLEHTDEKLGRENVAGVMAPAWGASKYHSEGGYAVYLVHTGVISWPFLEFLHLVRPRMDAIGLEPREHAEMLAELIRAIEYHDGAWFLSEDGSEGAWRLRDEYGDSRDGRVAPFNMMSAMACAYYWAWRNTDQPRFKERCIAVGNYMRNRLTVYECPVDDARAYFWKYWLDEAPVADSPRPWAELAELGGGEDVSHAAISVSFPILMAANDLVFDEEDMQLFANTLLHGFGRNTDGIFATYLTGDYRKTNIRNLLKNLGFWLPLSEYNPELYSRVLTYFRTYQKEPSFGRDAAKFLRYRP